MSDHPISSCPHCGQSLRRWTAPPEAGWGDTPDLVCFNDDCPYFVRGWDHMQEKFQVRVSYRYRCNPATGKPRPLAVWSRDALKDRILPDG